MQGRDVEHAVSLAKDAFAAAYPEREIIPHWLYVDAVEDGHIVTLLHVSTLPPERSWWHVRSKGTVRAIPLEEAARHIDIPVWR